VTTGTGTVTTGQVNPRQAARLIVVSLLGLAGLGTVETMSAFSLGTVILPTTRGDPR